MKFAVCNEIFQKWEIESVMEHVARLGYNGVEIAPFTLGRTVNEISPARRRQIRDVAARLGMEVCGLHWLLARTEGLHLNHPDRSVRDRTGDYLRDTVDCCADLGGNVLVLGSPQQRNVPAGTDPEQAWEWAKSTLTAAVRRAEERGVVICLEPLAPSETNFINTASEAIRFIRQIKSAALKIVLDVKAMCSEHEPIPRIIHKAWPDFAHFHANDSNLDGPGSGDVDFRPIARALKEVGYAAYVSVEVFRFEDGPEAVAARSLEYLRGAFLQ